MVGFIILFRNTLIRYAFKCIFAIPGTIRIKDSEKCYYDFHLTFLSSEKKVEKR